MSCLLARMGEIPRLSSDEMAALRYRIIAGDEAAREEMILANLRLVARMARRFEGLGADFDDLFSEGTIGLMKAVDHWNPQHGAFSTLALICIRRTIWSAVNRSRLIRAPDYIMTRWAHIQRVSEELLQALGRSPEIEEVAAGLAWPVTRVRQVRAAVLHVISLDELVDSQEDGYTLHDYLGDAENEDLGPSARQEEAEVAREWLSRLSSEERELLGTLTGESDRSLESQGDEMDLSRQTMSRRRLALLAGLRRQLDFRLRTPQANAGCGRSEHEKQPENYELLPLQCDQPGN